MATSLNLNYQPRSPLDIIRHVCIHTNEGPNLIGSAIGLANYLTSTRPTNNPVSYHVVVDNTTVVHYISDDQEAWAALGCNPIGLHLCLTGYAAQTRVEWLAYDGQLRLAASVVRDWCIRHRIPMQKISSRDVQLNHPGIIGHIDWTLGKNDGTHTDPGTNFPWDYFIGLVNMQDPKGMPTSSTTSSSKVDDMGFQNFRIAPGKGTELVGCPVGKASLISNQAWISSQILGPNKGQVWYWFQNDLAGIDDSKRSLPIDWLKGHSQRVSATVPDGTTQIRVDYDFPDGGTITLEVQPK